MSWFTDNILGDDPSGGGINTVIRDPLQIVNDLVHNPLGTIGHFIEGITLQGLATRGLYDYLKPPTIPIPPGTSASFDINGSGNLVNIPVVYGKRKISATVCPVGVDGNDLYVIALLCEGEISAINTIYLDDAESTDPRFTSNSPVNVHITKYLGTDSQAADATLIAKFPDVWTSAHQLKGLAYLVVKLTYDPNIFSAMPVITAEVEGKKVYDPRENLLTHSEELTNAAWIRDSAPTIAVTDNAITILNGLVQLSVVIPSASDPSVEILEELIDIEAGQQYTFSAFFKNYNGGPQFRLYIGLSGDDLSVTFSPVTGNIITHGASGPSPIDDYGVTEVEPDVFRGWVTFTPASAGTWGHQLRYSSNAGDGVHGMYFGAAQLNKGGLKAYAKTTTAAISPQTAYSANPALIIRDYLTNSIYGKGLDEDFINDDGIIKSAEISDVQIEKYSASPAPLMNQFECNAAVDTSQAILDNLKTLLQSCRGFISYYNGLYNLRVERDEDSVFDFTTDNMTGTISVANGGKANRLNRVTINYNNEAYSSTQSFVDDACIYDSSELRADDNNSVLETSIIMPAETSKYRVLWHAFYFVKRSRLQITCGIVATPEALTCVPGDIVTVTYEPLGWSVKKFRVTTMTLRIDCMVELSLIEHDSEIYDRTVPDEIDDISETTLPDPFTVAAPTGLTLASGAAYILIAAGGTILPRIYASWTAAEEIFISYYELQWKVTSDTVWQTITSIPRDQTGVYIGPLQDGIDYTVRVRTVNSEGRRSDWSSDTHTIANLYTAIDITFIEADMGATSAWISGAFSSSGGCIISQGSPGYSATSTDGVEWTLHAAFPNSLWTDVAFNGTYYCAISNGGAVGFEAAVSTNGSDWTTHAMPSNSPTVLVFNHIVAGGSIFVAVPAINTNLVATSTNGSTWEYQTLPHADFWNNIVFNGTIFCMVGDTYSLVSEDGENWTSGTAPTGVDYHPPTGLACNGDVFCMGNSGGHSEVAISSDGRNWETVSVASDIIFTGGSGSITGGGIASNGVVFCALGPSYLNVSLDGRTWYKKPLPTTDTIERIISDGKRFFILTNTSKIYASLY